MRRITDPFFRLLHKKLAEEMSNRIHALAEGSANTHGSDGIMDASATAMRYNGEVSYISAIQSVIDLCYELDHQQYGAPSTDEEREIG